MTGRVVCDVDIDRDETIDQARERELEEFPDIVGGHDIPLPPREPLVAAAGGEPEIDEPAE